MISAMIFDLDGVIADTHSIHRKAWRRLLQEQQREITEEQLDFVVDGRKREEILRHFLADLPAKELYACGQRKDELFFECVAELRAIPGAIEFVNELSAAAVPIALATSAGARRARYILEVLGLTARFSVVVTGDDVLLGKPDPSIFSIAAHRLRVCPGCSLVAEDSGAGVRAARRAGMRCLGIASEPISSRLRQEGADHVVRDFEGLSLSALQLLF